MTETGNAGSATEWRWVARGLKVALAATVALAAWIIGFRGLGEPAPVLPDATAQFSLDLEVITTIDHDIVYAVEQRKRPKYRIFSLDPTTGETATIFTVPENAIIYGIALNAARDTLAMAYSPDHNLDGNGIALLDLTDDSLTWLVDVTADSYYTDPAWSTDGTAVLATFVDRTGDDEALSVVRVDGGNGHVSTLAERAIDPVETDDTVFYLTVDDDNARRAIGAIDSDGVHTAITVGDGSHDLDHLIADPAAAIFAVAVLQPAYTGLTFGDPADAHGNHDRPSTWWNVNATSGTTTPTETEAISTYDATATSQSIVSATNEGLAIIQDGVQTDLIKSRAIRFVAA